MRVAGPIVLHEEIRRKLEQQARGRSTAARVVLRSRIVLLAGDGLQNKQIAKTLQVAPRMVTLWRGRFRKSGIEGLLKDAPQPGRTPSISPAVMATLIEKTTQGAPANATHWSTRTMAKEMGISKASVSHIWRANGLKPHRVESFKVSNDPQFADKLEAIVGLYLTQNRLRRGVFRDLEQLIMAIGEYIDGHYQNPKPFIWTDKANDILDKVTRAQNTLNKRRSA